MEGGGQPVLSCEQCFVSVFCLFACAVGGLGFECCMFALVGAILFGVSSLLLFLFVRPKGQDQHKNLTEKSSRAQGPGR